MNIGRGGLLSGSELDVLLTLPKSHHVNEGEMRQDLLPLIKCLECGNKPLVFEQKVQTIICEKCHMQYPMIDGCPVLLRSGNPIFCLDHYKQNQYEVHERRKLGLCKFIPSASVNLASDRVFAVIREIIEKRHSVKILVIGGGCQRQWLDEKLGRKEEIQTFYTDIDIGADVDLFCDAHELPFDESIFDFIIATAVLEHVLYPERVATEIHRVMKDGGIIYCEIPFMQQVHEGAYDFTRYTLSGHRRLLNRFDELDSGMVAGPATALVWAIENLALAFGRKSIVRLLTKAVVRIIFSWMKYLDYYLLDKPEAMDGASCTFFLGKKSNRYVSDADIIARYVGAKHISHT